MKIDFSEKNLKKQLTPEQFEKYKEAVEIFGEDSPQVIQALGPMFENNQAKKFNGSNAINGRIKQLRIENGLTQTDLANVLNITQREYWRCEQEGYSINVMRLANIAMFYNVSIDWFTGFTTERKTFFTEKDIEIGFEPSFNGYNPQKVIEAKAKGEKITHIKAKN